MSDLILVKAFCQANTVKGWRYLDVAGEIVNRHIDQLPDIEVGLNGLTMKNSSAVMDEARVSVRHIWVGFTRPATTRLVTDQAFAFINSVSESLGVAGFDRVGVRLQYLNPLPTVGRAIPHMAQTLVAKPLIELSGRLSSFESQVELALADDRTASIRVQPARLADPAGDPFLPHEGLLYDCDAARTGSIAKSDLRRVLREAAEWSEEHIRAIANVVSTEPTP